MITTHDWTGWWRQPDDRDTGPPEYGSCETVVSGVVCGRPRHEHKNLQVARRLPS